MRTPTPRPTANNEALSCAAMALLLVLMLALLVVGILGMAK